MAAMKVVFLAPSYPPEMQQYTRGLAEVGAEVYGVGDTPIQALPGPLKRYLPDYLQVPRLLDGGDGGGAARAGRRAGDVGRHRARVPRQAGDEGAGRRGRAAGAARGAGAHRRRD